MAPARIALGTGLLLLAAWPARPACTDPQDLLDFEQAVHQQLACELADRLLGEEGCEQSPVPECGVAALEQLAELLPGGFGDRLLASWGYSGALCRLALARASELTLHELLTQSAHESARAPTRPHASGAGSSHGSGGGRPHGSGGGQPHASGAGDEQSAAQQALSELEQTCDGVEVGLRAPVGGTCAMLAEWGDVLDGSRLRGCLTQALGRIAQEVKPGSSRQSGGSGHAGRESQYAGLEATPIAPGGSP